jgi:branched-chain amino acid transport system ATP-binding protein
MLTVKALCVRYGLVRAVENASLSLSGGEILSLVGLNGAGKSSLVHAICGLVKPASGRVLLEGNDVTGQPLHRLPHVALVPEGRVLAPSLSVRETLTLGAARLPTLEAPRQQARVLDLFPELNNRLDQRAGTLSGGEATMLAIARALMSRPRLLLLDEPTLGLSPAAAKRVFGALHSLRHEGLALLLVEQNLHMAAGIADRLMLLRHGQKPSEVSACQSVGTGALEDLLISTQTLGVVS